LGDPFHDICMNTLYKSREEVLL